MPRADEALRVKRLLFAAGAATVLVQLVMVRELLVRFSGNEFVIAVIFFIWLVSGAIGAFAAPRLGRFFSATGERLWWLALLLVILPQLMVGAVAILAPILTLPGVSAGFYPTLFFVILLISPYCFAIGVFFPWALARYAPRVSGRGAARIYLADTGGGVIASLLFVLLLVRFFSSFTVVVGGGFVFFLAALPFMPQHRRARAAGLFFLCLAIAAAALLRFFAPSPYNGRIVSARDSRFGRIEVVKKAEQSTVMTNGRPVFISQTPALAEELVHYPASLVASPRRMLFIGAVAGIFVEAAKYRPRTLDYLEIDPDLSRVLLAGGLVVPVSGLRVINRDPRLFLAGSGDKYDMIVIARGEPETFGDNRLFTREFMALVRAHLAPGGVFAFGVDGFENYLGPASRQRFACYYATMRSVFPEVAMIPGRKTIFIGSSRRPRLDIPGILRSRGIVTSYLAPFFRGEVTPERLRYLEDAVRVRNASLNLDLHPAIVRMVLDHWFERFAGSPFWFAVPVCVFFLLLLLRASPGEYTLLTAGFTSMAVETVAVFAFAVFHGYIFEQIGILISLALAGIFVGLRFGAGVRDKESRGVILAADAAIIVLALLWAVSLGRFNDGITTVIILFMTFTLSLASGLQFGPAINLSPDGPNGAAGAFGADLAGAGAGVLLIALVILPGYGLAAAVASIAIIKATGMVRVFSAG